MTKRIEPRSSLALVCILTLGIMTVWAIAFGFLVSSIEQFLRDNSYEWLEVCQDGTPIIRSGDSCRLLNGDPLPDIYENVSNWYAPALSSPKWKESKWKGISWQQRIDDVSQRNYYRKKQTEKWYFVHNGKLEGRGCFVGYNLKSQRCVGYIGRGGFRREEPPEAEQFSIDGRQMERRERIIAQTSERPNDDSPWSEVTYLMASDGCYKINKDRRTSELFWNDADLCSLDTLSEAVPLRPKKDYRSKSFLALRKPDRVLMLDDAGKVARSYVLPPEIQKEDFQWYELGGGKAMIVVSRREISEIRNSYILYWIEDGGKKYQSREVFVRSSGAGVHSEGVLIFPSPLAIAFSAAIAMENDPDSETSIEKSAQEAWPGLAMLGVVCIVLAWLCYRRQRAFGMPWTGAWVAFVLLVGVPGYLGYLAHRRWPARLACPNCGRLAPRDRSACLHCGREFPAPALTGKEVFLQHSPTTA